MLGFKNIKKTSSSVGFISAVILGLMATVCVGILVIPYYGGYRMITNGDNGGWWVIGVWTWIIFFICFHQMMKWIDKGKEIREKKKIDEMAKQN